MSFDTLGLSAELLRAVAEQGYSEPTPVQRQAIPVILQERDILAGAQTGTGKTAGFTLPLLQRLNARAPRQGRRAVRALILTPTRELAAQVGESVTTYGRHLPLNSAVIFGGVKINPQIQALRRGVDILVATPGRLLDHVSQKTLDLSAVEILVLDEADRMLDMGFIRDIRRILALLPQRRQNLLFSATYSNDIRKLADSLLDTPALIEVARRNTPTELVSQVIHPVDRERKRELLSFMVGSHNWRQVLVFTRTKHGANRLAEYLDKHGLPAVAIHGNKSQNARTKALADFKANAVRILVATDIAARGLDIDQLPHVVNFELPNVEEDYVHRIGRTGRAGRSGEAISLVAPDEEKLLKGIERMTKQKIPDGDLMGFDAATIEAEKPEVREPRQPRPARNSERKPRGERAAKTTETVAGEQKSGDRNRRGRNKPRNPRPAQGSAEQAAAAPVSRPPRLPSDRDPEVFLDDELDNFGNSVDYVSPYQNKQGRGRRPGAPAQPGGQPRAAAGPRSGPAGAGAQGKGKRQGGQGQSARGGQPRRKNEGRRIEGDNGGARREIAEKPKEKQPVIIHKESKLDRLPSIEQLEQLPTKPRGEKPALLTRNR